MRNIDLDKAFDYACFKNIEAGKGITFWAWDTSDPTDDWEPMCTYADLESVPINILNRLYYNHPVLRLQDDHEDASEEDLRPRLYRWRTAHFSVGSIVWVVAYNFSGKDIPFGEIVGVRNKVWAERYSYSFSRGFKRNWGRYYRQIRTLNERKQATQVDGEPPIRAKRKPNVLPTGWDDFPIHYQKSWKKHRKTQWKSKKGQ